MPPELAGYEELLVGAWRDLVARVDGGYDDTFSEFRNDLAVRDLLDERVKLVSDDEVRARLMQEISEADARFRNATRSVERPINGRDDASWWWLRVPRKLRGGARNAFAGAGVTSPVSLWAGVTVFALFVALPAIALIVLGATRGSWWDWALAILGGLWITWNALGIHALRRKTAGPPVPGESREEHRANLR